MSDKRTTISVLVENEFGVLTRVVGLFSGRGYNIESLNVAETLDPSLSIITLVTRGDAKVISQIIKTVMRLIPVLSVQDVGELRHVERELILLRVRNDPSTSADAVKLVNIFGGSIVEYSDDSFLVELTGDEGKINASIAMFEPYGLLGIIRSGKVALTPQHSIARPVADTHSK